MKADWVRSGSEEIGFHDHHGRTQKGERAGKKRGREAFGKESRPVQTNQKGDSGPPTILPKGKEEDRKEGGEKEFYAQDPPALENQR